MTLDTPCTNLGFPCMLGGCVGGLHVCYASLEMHNASCSLIASYTKFYARTVVTTQSSFRLSWQCPPTRAHMKAARHKRMESDDLDVRGCPWLQPTNAQGLKEAQAPTSTGSSPQPLSRVRNTCALLSNNNRDSSGGTLLHGASGQSVQGTTDSSTPSTTSVVLDGILKYRGVKVRVKSSPTGLSWKPTTGAWAWCLEMAALKTKIPYDEVLGAWPVSRTKRCSCLCRTEHTVVVAALQRPRSNPSAWKLKEHVLVASSSEQAKEWVAAITSALQLCYDRPRALLVFVNPYSGSKRARHVWHLQAAPVFMKAGIKVSVVETTAADHARSLLASMKADELGQYQGVVAVGGDGVFQECVMGLMAQRAREGKNAIVASRMRVGHIPGGSTDAVAFTLHGTRSAEAAALHIALGDRMALDVARVDCHAHPSSAAPASHPVALPQPATSAAPGAATAVACMDAMKTAAGVYSPPQLLQTTDSSALLVEGPGVRSDSLVTPPAPVPIADAHATHTHGINEQLSTSAPGHKHHVITLEASGGSEHVALMGAQGTAAAQAGRGAAGSLLMQQLTTPLNSRYFVCQAAYGFLGDVMQFSEGLRCLGPTRYDVSGLVQFLRLKSYPLQISYRPAPLEAADRLLLCSTQCEACRMAGIDRPHAAGGVPHLLHPYNHEFGPHVATTHQQHCERGHEHKQQPSAMSEATPAATGCAMQPPMLRLPTSPAGSPPNSTLGAMVNTAACRLPSGSGLAASGRANSAQIIAAMSKPGIQSAMRSSSSASKLAASATATESSLGSSLPPSGRPSTAGGSSTAASTPSGNTKHVSVLVGPGEAAANKGGPITDANGWVTLKGEFISVMAVVTPCRSDKTLTGIIPHAHLNDGRIYLVMVSKCHHLDYLRFLIRMSSKGLHDKCLPFVRVVPVAAAVVRPMHGGPASVWNVDGELLPSPAVTLRVARGMQDVFARGVEMHGFVC